MCCFRAVLLLCAKILNLVYSGRPLPREAFISSHPPCLGGLHSLRNCEKLVRKCAKRFAVHPGPDLALCVMVPEGHGLGEVRQLLGSNKGGSREGRKEKKCSRGHLPSPLARHARERTRANSSQKKHSERRGNQIGKECQRQT